MSYGFVIANADAVLPTGRRLVDIGIDGGKIVEIADARSLGSDNLRDASGLIALPGCIDMHVHFREPGATHKEDFLHGTTAAACGGVTSVCDMPNTIPAVTSAEVLADKLARVSRSARVDFALWAGGTRIEEFEAMKRLGAVGLKVYMNRAKPGSQSYSSDLSMPDDAVFKAVMERAGALDWPICVHVQSPDVDELHVMAMRRNGQNTPRDVCDMARAPESAEAQRRVIALAADTGARVHIAHLSFNSMQALHDLREARDRGARITSEVVPPCLSHIDLDRVGPLGIPFAHPEAENAAYWAALRDGTIDVVATDHAPHTFEEKTRGGDDAWGAASGYPGVETMVPLLVDAALSGTIGFERLAQVASEAPARICGFADKGALAVGKDADIVLVDPCANWTIDQARLHSKAGWSPYHGRTLRGRLTSVYLRGLEVARDGEPVAVEVRGRPLTHP